MVGQFENLKGKREFLKAIIQINVSTSICHITIIVIHVFSSIIGCSAFLRRSHPSKATWKNEPGWYLTTARD
ncbi:hypothetical protein M405DRAFT_867544 [Rhizopogon salebrosus TDB-379]|nr:hypothetical protein M405DRAFT_867544 [Rhizopogon salebrosus TDB-379]